MTTAVSRRGRPRGPGRRVLCSGSVIGAIAALLTSCSHRPPVDGGSNAPIVVTSAGDTIDDDGRCTLREAIVAANDDQADGTAGECRPGDGPDRIRFAIDRPSGSAGAGSVATIVVTRPLPPATETVVIDGFSQPGAHPNSAPSPEPLNGRLRVELDGSHAGDGADGLMFDATADRSIVRGLVIAGFDGSGIMIDADDVRVEGSYIGTDPSGSRSRGNGFAGVSTGLGRGTGAIIGGRHPDKRNLISGNGSSGAYPNPGTKVLGNLIGTDAGGTKALPNGKTDGAGALSVDDAPNVVVGGGSGGANLISGNASIGIAPKSSPGLKILGNRIGTDWSGTNRLPNEAGIALSGKQSGTLIGGDEAEGNIISGNLRAGVIDGSDGGVQILGNTIGLDRSGSHPVPNEIGVAVRAATTIGDGTDGHANTISGNAAVNVMVRGADTHASGTTIDRNRIGTSVAGAVDPGITAAQGAGVWIAGDVSDIGVGLRGGNLIAGNRGFAVGISSYSSEGGTTLSPRSVVVAGNEIKETQAGDPWPGSTGEAIEWFHAEDTSRPFHPLDAHPEIVSGLGERGPGQPARPVVTSARRTGSTISVRLDPGLLDGAARCSVEISLTPASDPSGSSMPLGKSTVAAAGDQVVEVPAPTGAIPRGALVRAASTCSGGAGTNVTSELSDGLPLTGG